MDEAEGLSEALKSCPFCGCTLIDPEGWVAAERHGPACQHCGATGESVAAWNARAESRSTPDREGVARIIDPDEWDALDRGLITTKGRQLTATAALKARYCKRSLAKADAILALARRSITVAEPDAPGGFVGDIWFGHPVKRTLGTHRWTGAAWEELPDETVALMELLAAAREKIAALALARPASSAGGVLADVLAERRRQVEVKGWSPEHDDEHTGGEIANAAADYALPGQFPQRHSWAYGSKVIDKEPRRQQLIKAAALIIAEIERLDRADSKGADRG